MHVSCVQPRGIFIRKIEPDAVNLRRSIVSCANEMSVDQTQSVGHFHGVTNLDCHILEGYEWQQPNPKEAHSPVINRYSICSVSGGMKVVESWRFEIPFSSAAFSSDPSR